MEVEVQTLSDWARSNIELIAAIGSAIVAMFGAFLSARETRKQRKLQIETLRQRVDAASLDWGNEAISLLGEAGDVAQMCTTPVPGDAIDERKRDVARRLSAMVDRGRLFFPNIDPGSKGAEKEGAYRGHRPPILDALMYAFYEVQEISRNNGPSPQDSANFIFDCRRLLVSELQAHLDPRRRDEIIDRYNTQRQSHRDDALKRAGRLGLKLDARRPGLLTKIGERGWTEMIGPEERRKLLDEVLHSGEEEMAGESVTPLAESET